MNKRENSKITCKICKKSFDVFIERHYIARDVIRKGIVPAISGYDEGKEYDAFDCPFCGCQNVVQERKIVIDTDLSDFTDLDDDDTEEEEE